MGYVFEFPPNNVNFLSEQVPEIFKKITGKYIDLDNYVVNLMNQPEDVVNKELGNTLVEKEKSLIKEPVRQKLDQSDLLRIANFNYGGDNLKKIADALNSIPDDLIQYMDKIRFKYDDNQKKLYVNLIKEHGNYDTELRLTFDISSSVYITNAEFVFVRKNEYTEEAYVDLLDDSKYNDQMMDLVDTVYKAKVS